MAVDAERPVDTPATPRRTDRRGARVAAWARSPHGRFSLACAVGGLAAMAVFAWFALDGTVHLFANQPLANFYEVQARSWLHGHWDAAPGAYIFERFRVHGRFYTYFGPWPALLRLPVVLFTRRYDGDLSRASMLLAFAVLLTFAARLAWQTRTLLRGDGPPTRATLGAAAGFVFVAGCGSTALFLASDTWVYNEAILWGLAWSLASFSFLLTYLVHPTRRSLALASVTATFGYLSRGSVGVGPVAALALVLLTQVARRVADAWRARRSEPSPSRPAWWLRGVGLGDTPSRSIWPLALATGVPLALYAYVNEVKFRTLFGTPPYQLQDLLLGRPGRQAALAANGGSLFGLKYAPTILLASTRPDAIRFDRLFPWVSFAGPPHVVGHVVFEAINFYASVPATSTLLVLLAVVGVIAAIRAPRRDGGGPSPATLRVPMLGAGIGCLGTLYLAFLEERYLGDVVPFLVLAGAAGLWWLPTLLAHRTRAARRLVGGVLVVLGVWSCWATGALTLLQQRAYGPLVSTSTRAHLINFQLGVHEQIPGGTPSGVEHTALTLPRPARANTLLVVGDCAGLYWSDGRFWHAIEETPQTGSFVVQATFAAAPTGSRSPLLAATDAQGSSLLWVRQVGPNRIRFEYQWTGPPRRVIEGATPDVATVGKGTSRTLAVAPGQTLPLELHVDPAGYVSVTVRGQALISTFAPVATTPATLGTQPVAARGAAQFAGTLRLAHTPTPICDRLRRDERAAHQR